MRLRSIIVLTAVLTASAIAPGTGSASPVRLDFAATPPPPWNVVCGDPPGASAADGILTIDSDCFEYQLSHPDGDWHRNVSNSRGWAIETRVRLDDTPGADVPCPKDGVGAAGVWANDHRVLVIFGFSTEGVCLAYPDDVTFPMNTTAAFHTYRFEVKGLRVRVLVDGVLKIDHVLTWTGGGSDVLMFGALGGGRTGEEVRSHWDYLEYDTFASGALPTCFGKSATIVGTTAADMLTGTSGPDVIFGWDGNDTIRGLGGDDRICAGAGADDLRGGPGSDFLQAGRGSDTLVGNAGSDNFDGGGGSDIASFASSTTAVHATLAEGTASGQGADILVGVEDLVGSAFADRLTGDDGPNRLFGKDGRDSLDGAGGIDFLDGGGGLDSCVNGETLLSC